MMQTQGEVARKALAIVFMSLFAFKNSARAAVLTEFCFRQKH